MLFDIEIYELDKEKDTYSLVDYYSNVDVSLNDSFGQIATAKRGDEVVARLYTFDDNPTHIEGDTLYIGGFFKDKEDSNGNHEQFYGHWLLRHPSKNSNVDGQK